MTQKRSAKKWKLVEAALYEPIRLALLEKFETVFSNVHIENTSEGRFSPKLREALLKSTLHVIRVETMKPDLTGYYNRTEYSTERFIVEVKARKLRIKDVYQTKLYGDVLNAEYAILISSESLTREIREFIKENYLTHRRLKDVIILKYIERLRNIIIEPKVLEDIYGNRLPEFLKTDTE